MAVSSVSSPLRVLTRYPRFLNICSVVHRRSSVEFVSYSRTRRGCLFETEHAAARCSENREITCREDKTGERGHRPGGVLGGRMEGRARSGRGPGSTPLRRGGRLQGPPCLQTTSKF